MSDAPEVRVFDSVTAAVENSLPPAPPPYAAEIENPQEAVSGPETPAPVPVGRKTSGKRTQASTGGVTAQAGTAAPTVAAKAPSE
jgi:hypothetical protein